jgi:hypothetical protein
MDMRLAFNMLAILGAGAFAGLMLNIGLTLGAYWKGLPPAAFLDWFSSNSHLIGRTIPIVAVPTVIGICASLWLGWNLPGARLWWGIALTAIAGLMLITAAFHLPTNADFAAKSMPLDQVSPMLDRWLLLHWVRIALGFVATAAGILAVAR